MNWQDVSGKSAASVAHWQKISQFRARHPAIGAGKQTTLSLKQGYGFVREHGDDKVLVGWAGQQSLFRLPVRQYLGKPPTRIKCQP